ncbi:aminoglycoside N(3)-acetyltransferase [Paraburkholderia susongensis]|uniref:Aminoglycoside N(3)-acetyltransferase n=1 Tax=Paraburkholderia susongensis TaxID=1515439 RepID=A0A1X7LWP7_9BURK|nr:AAC(3) family N-acetyltransferase [Paraburkholderia susongensis]SMG57934.1 aminoglycoside 3-N-acetyltransferase [Paraburkholderia susongensis]
MKEAELIARTKAPITARSLANELALLGLGKGAIVLVHSSLSSLGWVCGGPVSVIKALIDTVGDSGTIVMPAQSRDLTDPANWGAPPVPQSWIETIRETMPAYDPRITPTRDMGQIAEIFRNWPGVVRSNHPSASFAALGPAAMEVIAHQKLEDPLGEDSPLSALYRLDSIVLLIGVDFNKCTALHFAERKVWPNRPKIREGAPLLVEGERRWISFETPELMDSDDFLPIGDSARIAGLTTTGSLGEGHATLLAMRDLVDHAVAQWSSQP